jgi:NTP pyrophosphatase (non-canonical NTP hydrolase)
MTEQDIIDESLLEVDRAEKKHPDWPRDLVYAGAIVAEESGELIRACVQSKFEQGDREEVRKEAIQTIATCIRLLKNMDRL